jgi:methionyl-tRNA formyltransferase
MPRITLAGNNLASIFTLDLLLEVAQRDELLVIAPEQMPDPAWQESLASYAAGVGVDCIMPSDVNETDVVKRVAAQEPDLFLSVYYTQLFRGELMSVIRGKALNFHPSLLPLHRGNAPLIWAIAEGDSMTGLSVHHIDAGIDTGCVVVQRKLPIHERDTGYELHRKMAKLVRATAAEIVRDVVAGQSLPAGREQSGPSSYHSIRDPRLNHLAWSDPCERIRNIVRALAPPLPGAYSLLNGIPVVVARVDRADVGWSRMQKTPGMIEIGRDGTPVVWAGDGALRLTAVVADGAVTPGATLVTAGRLGEGQVLG